MHQFSLVQTGDGLGQGVVIAVTFAAHRGLYARFGQAVAVADGNVLGEFNWCQTLLAPQTCMLFCQTW